jgi:protein SCO1
MNTLKLLALAGLLGCFACDREPAGAPAKKADAPTSAHESLPAQVAPSGAPLYDLRLTLTAHDSREIGLDEFRGKPVLISMFYGSCAYACPTLIGDIKRIERQLPPDTREALRVLLVSFDAEHDTPARLQELIATHGLDQRRWILASASDESALPLAAALGIRYRKLPSGAFNHTSLITLLDPAGRIVAQSEGLNRDNAVIVRWLASQT